MDVAVAFPLETVLSSFFDEASDSLANKCSGCFTIFKSTVICCEFFFFFFFFFFFLFC